MLVEDQRFIHEDIERLEQGISDRFLEHPSNVSMFICLGLRLLMLHRSKNG